MTKEKAFSEIRDLIERTLGIPGDEISPESELAALGADSLDVEEILLGLEDVFLVNISDTVAEKVKTVQDCMNLLQKSKGAAA